MSKLRLRETWPGILLILIGVVGIIFNLVTKIPAPIVMSESDIPDDTQLVYARFDNIELIGYDHIDRRYLPGELISMTLYWRLIEPTEEDLMLSLALINPFGDIINHQEDLHYPGDISLETSTWELGRVYPLTYILLLDGLITSSHPFSLSVNLYDTDMVTGIDAIGEAGDLIDVVLGVGAVVMPNIRVSRANLQILSPDIRSRTFGNRLRVEGFGYNVFEEELTFNVDVLWEVQGNIDTDYVTFMHIYDADANLVSQYDRQAQLPTHYWREEDEYRLTYRVYPPEIGFAPGIYSVNVGWYELRYNDTSGLYTSINLLIDSEISMYQLFEFEVDEEGEIILPTLDIEN